ncbi:MAG: anthranilate phosphoribosyltransferase [Opitutales bacterium]|nr:anthranilate phosphoribosyltransferase [Opitutales bacterium]
MDIFLLDNFDSFVYNLVDEFRSYENTNVFVYRNSVPAEYIFEKMQAAKNPVLVISPGPGMPDEAGCLLRLVALCHRKYPILGICLGHQAICQYYGGSVVPAAEIMHGKSSLIEHSGEGPFSEMPSPLPFARYHSLVGAKLPNSLEVIAHYHDVPMAVMNRADRVLGFQFHPESIMSPRGSELLRKSLKFITREERRGNTLEILNRLYKGENLSKEQSSELFNEIISGNVDATSLAGALVALKMKGETPEEISGAADALLLHAKKFPRPDYPFGEIVGTGGDGVGTINISSTSALLAASMGVKIAKHGNRSVSSKTGSSDLLKALGIATDLSPEAARESLDRHNFCFMRAPLYHSGMRFAMPVRQSLKTRTIFNVLGPLINPAHPTFALVGVYAPSLLMPIAESLKRLGYRRAMVVYGAGLDEMAIHGETQVAELLENGEIRDYAFQPEDFGLKTFALETVLGGNPEENRVISEKILKGKGSDAQNAVIALNTGALLYLNGTAGTLAEGVARVREHILSGNAWDFVQKMIVNN